MIESWRRVVLVPYDASWPRRFEEHAARIKSALGDTALGVEHIGSTSVPGLTAKPIIDIQVQVRSFEPFEAYRVPLERAGYDYRADDDPEHRFFKRDENGERVVNIHVVEVGSWWGRRDVAFRDYLRAHPDEAARYESLKRELASRFPDDVQAYADAKTAYVTSVHAMAGGDFTMQEQALAEPLVVLERLVAAQNAHDLDAMVDLFADDYRSEQPIHPARRFAGNAQVRKNWSALFGSLPDFHVELLRAAANGDTGWAECRWIATKEDGSPFEEAIVIIFGVRDGRISWARLYGDEVEREGADIDETVRTMTRTAARD